MVSIFALFALGAPLTLAQDYGNSGGSSSSSSAAPSATDAPSLPSGTHAVQVGQDGFAFTPSSLNVPVGDTVEFFFHPTGHGVAQASFDKPCHPANGSAFWSGFMSVSSGVGANSFKLKINNSDPVWFYCPQTGGNHCQSGMVGVVNPPSSGNENLQAFKNAAAKASTSTNPSSVQGGVVGAADKATTSSSSSSPSPSTGAGAPNAIVSNSLIGAVLALFGTFVSL